MPKSTTAATLACTASVSSLVWVQQRLVAQQKRGCVVLGARRGNGLVVPAAVPVQVADVVVAVLLAGDHAPGCSGFALAPPDIDTAAPPDAARLVELVTVGALSELPTTMSTVDPTGPRFARRALRGHLAGQLGFRRYCTISSTRPTDVTCLTALRTSPGGSALRRSRALSVMRPPDRSLRRRRVRNPDTGVLSGSRRLTVKRSYFAS
jgi:hypothetical protein